MKRPAPPRPVLLMTAIFSRHPQAIAWAKDQAVALWGPIVLASDPFPFEATSYYKRSMGEDLRKQFFAFERLADPALLPDWKHQALAWEEESRRLARWPEERPVNIDPGYLTEAKLVLATTKDRDHRLYLSKGIFAEVTLSYCHGAWQSQRWTYSDYRQADYHRFFVRCRDYLRSQLHTE